jgi:hypothetical protein
MWGNFSTSAYLRGRVKFNIIFHSYQKLVSDRSYDFSHLIMRAELKCVLSSRNIGFFSPISPHLKKLFNFVDRAGHIRRCLKMLAIDL